ncbi:MAG: 4Fe-4S dicluster domain-containing protein [Candidatus Neomarinimicrobiota bacterium]|nr:MAG: 4Fe-4S dicluster domain-containing protein [Candidatus Neomarinimicrobiota bacterium]
MLSGVEKILFLLLTLASLGGAFFTFRTMFRLIARGQEPLDWSRIPGRLGTGLMVFLTQKTLFRTRPIVGFLHALVAWGFTLYMLVNVIDVLEGLVTGFQFLPHHWLGALYRVFVDVFSVLVLVGVAFFLIRRFVTGDLRLLTENRVLMEPATRQGIRTDSMIVGVFILLHVGFRLIGASFDVAQQGGDLYQPAATFLGKAWCGFTPGMLETGRHVGWWGALGLILAFIPYFPYSKHAHLFMGPLNHMVSPDADSPAALPALDFEQEDVEQFGTGRLNDLSQKQLLDAYACIMCNRCQDQCPAYTTGKQLSPSAIEINKRYYLKQHGKDWMSTGNIPDEKLTQWMVSEEAAWSCTTCAFCVEVCPVGNTPLLDILTTRQDLVMMESDFPQDAMEVFNKLETYGNPWGLSSRDREKWMEGLEVPLFREKKSAEYLYWVGCAGAYDSRGKDISRAMVTILKQAGVDFAVLGTEETCTGDSARRIGNEYLFQMLAAQNRETLEKYSFQTIITQCPHCFSTLKNDYARLGMHFDVLHHTQFIARLIDQGSLSLSDRDLQAVTFHDPCYLGRHNREFNAPREVLNRLVATESAVREMPRNRSRSYCCGAGGGNMWYEINRGQRINQARFLEAAETGAETVVTACNFCLLMMEDAMKVTNHEDRMRVRDLAELVADRLQA